MPPVIRPEHPTPRSLSEIVRGLGVPTAGDIGEVAVTGITLSSAEVRPGDLYVGLRGLRRHGAEFAADARAAGAVALLTDAEGAAIAAGAGLPVVTVEAPRDVLGELADRVYRTGEHPPVLFGVTGTNGKTSTVYLLEGMLRQLGLTTGLSSTAERHIGGTTYVSRLTTPEASELHALLARMREEEVRAVAIEVSAQALTWRRVDGILFDVVGFTNLSHDHLDDYADMEDYFHAKLALFDPRHARRGVVSLDTPWGARVVRDTRIPVTTIATRRRGADADPAADWLVEVTAESAERTGLRLTARDGRSIETTVPIIGWHMAANAGLAIVLLLEAGFELGRVAAALADGVDAYLPGRTERVSGERGPAVFVDFGHSPDAFENTLAAVRSFTPGRTIMVFGADGDRDATKRHEMARVAAEGSDILVITDHHPRFEDPASIRATLLEGAQLAEHQPEQTLEVSPPEAAIRAAVGLAREGDAILWAGPGHQDYRDIRGVRTEYSARDEARRALREAGWA
ncbi:MAG: UDP-N-acetylmuramoyl-L-alanyl-D-glutamate--2,6-diaminopimelate ligase [Micrococcales bacterium]|nr:UDP-N-acetylmuramoyl-L-alanyl-D-glutamate--2,6-diaminopimelate ligase [Micrococcales bacterium]